MRKFTQEQVDAIQPDEYGRRYFEHGDYEDIKSFGERCSFGEGCKAVNPVWNYTYKPGFEIVKKIDKAA